MGKQNFTDKDLVMLQKKKKKNRKRAIQNIV